MMLYVFTMMIDEYVIQKISLFDYCLKSKQKDYSPIVIKQ